MKSLVAAVFTLILAASAGGQTVTVVAPNGGESWALGSVQDIRWAGGGEPGSESTVTVLLVQGTSTVGTIAENVSASAPLYCWTVGQYVGGTAAVGNNYKIRVQHTSGAGADTSNGFFSITSTPAATPTPSSLRVTSPNGGESWRIGTDRTISWTSTNVAGQVKLELIREPNTVVGLIATNLQASGNRAWKAGEFQGGTANAGEYRVRVTSLTQPTLGDASDQPFNLTSLHTGLKAKAPAVVGANVPAALPRSVTLKATYENGFSMASAPPHPESQLPRREVLLRNDLLNVTAQVGVDWFAWQGGLLGSFHRARIHFNVKEYESRAGSLKSAELVLVGGASNKENCTWSACYFAFFDIQTAWTGPDVPPPAGSQIYVIPTSTKKVDVTDLVRGWLDGSKLNLGLAFVGRQGGVPKQPMRCRSNHGVELRMRF